MAGSAGHTRQCTRRPARIAVLIAACAASSLLSSGCEPPPPTSAAGSAAAQERVIIPPPEVLPEHDFAAGLEDEYPDVVEFVHTFLETCLAGDYSGYRQMASRRRPPESRDRFQAIYHALRSVTVSAIDELDLPDFSGPVYRVITDVEFKPDSKVRLRQRGRAVAILVFREGGEWRMTPAPSRLQPQAEQPLETQPTAAAAPEYPWDATGDY